MQVYNAYYDKLIWSDSVLTRLSKRIVWYFAASLFLLINFCNLVYYDQHYWPWPLTPLRVVGLSFGFILITIAGIWLLRLLWPHLTGHWEPWVLGLALVLRVGWVLVVRTPPVQDYLSLHQASIAFAQGVANFATSNRYLANYPYMLGFVLYQGSVIKLFGNSLLLLQLLNSLFSVITIYFVGKISRQLYGERAQILALLMMTVYVPNVVATSVLTNDILAVMFFMAAIWLLIARPLTWRTGLAIGLLMFLGNFIRPLATIILLAVTLYAVLIALPTHRHKYRYLLGLISLLLTFGVATVGSNMVVQAAKLTPQSIVTTNTAWKLAVGLNSKTDGKWNEADYAVVAAGKTAAERTKLSQKLLKQRLAQPEKLPGLMAKKFAIMWADIDTMTSWGTKQTRISAIIVDALCIIQRAMYVIITVLVSLTLLKRPRVAANLIMILLIGYILIHFGIEIQTRYRYFAMPLMVILASGAPALWPVNWSDK